LLRAIFAFGGLGMKVNRDLRPFPDQLFHEQRVVAQNRPLFQELLKSHANQIQSSQLQYLMSEIEKASKRLEKSRSLRDLMRYKSFVKKYVKEALDTGLQLKKTYTWDEYGQSHPLKIVEMIDEKLIELMDEFLKKEKDHLKILSLLGEIEGLLINLYV